MQSMSEQMDSRIEREQRLLDELRDGFPDRFAA